MKPVSLTVEIAGHPLVLSNLRACFDPVLRCLFVADAHFGKDAVFRARGVPVPVGSTADNLMRLDMLIAEFEPAMLVFLGDLLHARESHADARRSMRCMRGARGMRDCGWCWSKAITTGMRARCRRRCASSMCRSPGVIGPWALCHHPQTVDDAYVLAGHLHPVYRISTRTDSVRVPCFRFGTRAGVLPAFGAFTGGFEVNGGVRGEALYVIAGERVFPLSDRSTLTLQLRELAALETVPAEFAPAQPLSSACQYTPPTSR